MPMNSHYTKHYFIESDRIVSKIGGGMENLNYNIYDHVYAFDIQNESDYEKKGLSNDTMMYRHIDSVNVSDEVLMSADFKSIGSFIHNNERENDIYYYHKDHIGSSTQISDYRARIIHHIEYMPSGEQFAEQRSTWGTNYKFNGKELDAETGFYYYVARYYSPDKSIWLSVDPMSDKYPSMSPYMYCAGNPVILVDPDGMDINPTTDGWNIMSQAFESTLGDKNPFFRNEKTGKVEYDKSKIVGTPDNVQQEIIDHYTTLVDDHDFQVNVNVVENDVKITDENGNKSLYERGANGLAVLSDDNKSVEVYLSKKPFYNDGSKNVKHPQTEDVRSIVSLHEIGGHAFFWQQKVYDYNLNIMHTSDFEMKARSIFKGKHLKDYIRNQPITKHF